MRVFRSFIPSGALLQVFRRSTSIVSGIATRSLSQVTRDRARMATPAAGRPPMVETETLAKLVSELYPFKAVEAVKQLPSYDDRNYYFRGTTEEKGEGEEFVLKLFNSVLFADRAVVEGQNSLLAYLHERGFTGMAYPIPSKAGLEVEEVPVRRLTPEREEEKEERTFLLRVVNYIPGEIFDHIDKVHVTPRLLYDIGKYAGRMDSLLQEFSHPGVDGRDLLDWDLTHFLWLRRFLSTITDPKKKAMFETVLGYFENHVIPKIPDFTTGTVHGDINGLNVIVQPKNDHYTMTGLIDFGDTIRTCYVFELGIMLGYTMVENTHPIPLVGPMLCGYLEAFPLSEEELDCLYYVVLARMCQSAVKGDYQFTLEPWNTYLLTTPAKAWRLIEEMLSTSKEEVDQIWAEARKKKAEDF